VPVHSAGEAESSLILRRSDVSPGVLPALSSPRTRRAQVPVMEFMCDDMPTLSIVIKLEFPYH